MWACPKCGSKVDETFDVCWSCGTSKEGVVDPAFLRADEAGPIGEPLLVTPIAAPGTGVGAVPMPELGEMVECYAASSLSEARFVADQLLGQGIPAVAHALPYAERARYDSFTQAHVLVQARDAERAKAWIAAHDLPRRAREAHGALGDDLVDCYQAMDLMEARFLADQLSAEGIPAVSDTEDMHAELGSMNASPRVWVRARDYTRAREWLENFDRQRRVEQKPT